MNGDLSLLCRAGDAREGAVGRPVRLSAIVLAMLVLAGAVSSTLAAEPPTGASIQGVVSLIWGDGSEHDQRSVGPVAMVTDAAGHVVELVLTQTQTAPLGGLLALNGKQVIVRGDWAAAPSEVGAKTILKVASIAFVEGEVPGAPDTVSGSQPWVSVMCKFSDYSDEPKSLSYFQNMFGSSYPGLDHYWRKVSYDKINVVGSAAKGWFVLPYPRSHYVDGSGNADVDALFADCTQVADSQIYYPSYVGINLMFNRDIGPFAWGGSRYATLDGTTRVWRVTWEPPWGYGNVCVMSHEMGHGFGFPHSAFNPANVYDNAWDIMSDTWSYTVHDPTYGSVGQETISYHKAFLAGWLSSQQREDIGVGTSDTVTLERLAEPSKPALEMVRLPIGGSSTHYYTVEARKKNGYDVSTPGSAVIIHEVDTGRTIPALVQGTNGAAGAMWTVGEVFRDAAAGIGVAVLASTDTGFTIAAANGNALAASLLDVDTHAVAGSSSDLNGILEPGESAVIAPSWTNVSTGSVSPTGAFSAFTGPAGATYTIADSAADYGAVAPANMKSCWATGNCYRVTVSNPVTRPAAHWDTTITETLTSGASRTWTLHIGSSFTDVPSSRWEYPFVEALYHYGLTAGCGNGQFCPDIEINRREMAVQTLRALGVVDQPAWQNIFSDMPACDANPAVFCWSRWAEELYRRGISAGCYYNPSTGERRFCPTLTLPREQMAVQVLRALGVVDQPAWQDIFSDMPACDPDPTVFCWSRWAEEYFRRGITAGCYYDQGTGERRFCPQGPVPRSHMAVFLVRSFELGLYGP